MTAPRRAMHGNVLQSQHLVAQHVEGVARKGLVRYLHGTWRGGDMGRQGWSRQGTGLSAILRG